MDQIIVQTMCKRFCRSPPWRAAFTLLTASLMEKGVMSSSSFPETEK